MNSEERNIEKDGQSLKQIIPFEYDQDSIQFLLKICLELNGICL